MYFLLSISGEYKMSVQDLSRPPPNYMCHEVDEEWVAYLKGKMRTHPSPHKSLFPVLIDPDTPLTLPDDHQPTLNDVMACNCNLWLLGGNHRIEAAQSLCSEEANTDLIK